jgi:hypothetical protein
MAAVEAALASRAEAPAQLTWAHVDGAVRRSQVDDVVGAVV